MTRLSEIINDSFLKAVFQTAFKQRILIPIFKSGDIEEILKYRPITNLHFASEVIEKIISLQLKHFLNKHAVFDEHQSAYRKYQSSETALLDLTSNLLWGLNNKSTITTPARLDCEKIAITGLEPASQDRSS